MATLYVTGNGEPYREGRATDCSDPRMLEQDAQEGSKEAKIQPGLMAGLSRYSAFTDGSSSHRVE